MAKAKKYQSISKRLHIMVSITFIILVAIVLVITYNREEKRMVEEYRKMADGVTNLMIERFDPKRIIIRIYTIFMYISSIRQMFLPLPLLLI